MSLYRKKIEENSFEYQFYQSLGFPPESEDGGIPLILRITLVDMELIDGFYMSLPSHVSNLPVERVIQEYILCEDKSGRDAVRNKLYADPNFDLPDIYEALLELYQQAEADRIRLTYHINNGASNIKTADPVCLHEQIYPCDGNDPKIYRLLDLVLEVRDNPFFGITDEQKEEMLDDFRKIFVLYCMDKFGDDSAPIGDALDAFSEVLERLASEEPDLVDNSEGYSITPMGRDLLAGIIKDAEFYIDNYDIFGDVYVRGFNDIRFNLDYGDNLIVPVFIRDGIDPYRALFTVALYLGNMDYLLSEPSLLLSDAPFERLFSLISNSLTIEDIGEEFLDRIIREGKSEAEGFDFWEARFKRIRNIERRINKL
jgi:hypothetical protein